MRAWLERRWYAKAPPPLALRPLSALYGALAALHRRRSVAQRLGVPVIVVGNLSVGGTGKTPFTIWLVERLRAWGFRPGVISRGYGGRAPHYPYRVPAQGGCAEICGDEPLLIARRTGVPVMLDADRVAAARALAASGEVDVLVADDGLQHHRLARDLEICVIDGVRGFGNGALLPAGPLRESPQRLHAIPLVVVNGGTFGLDHPGRVDMRLEPGDAHALAGGAVRPLASFAGQSVHAVAGIGHPERFFRVLRGQGMQVIAHAFADHHAFTARDLEFGDERPVLMTDKDAIKCDAYARAHHYRVPVRAVIDPAGEARVQQCCDALPR